MQFANYLFTCFLHAHMKVQMFHLKTVFLTLIALNFKTSCFKNVFEKYDFKKINLKTTLFYSKKKDIVKESVDCLSPILLDSPISTHQSN